jgi:hypothetical protein
MNLRVFIIFAPLFALLPLQGYGQAAPHPGAERALERIVLEQDFGDDLKFYSREVVTIAENPKVRGLNGLMFMRWKGAEPATEVVASVQWFEDTSDLLPFYRAEKARTGRGLLPIADTVIWKTGENSYLWTDGEHFVVGLGGSPAPPLEMLEAWLALVESNPPDLGRVPTAAP